LGFEFAPRIKNVPGQRLYGFEKRKGYELRGYKLLPDAYINTELIAEQGDEILRFVATIKLKEATASQLFKRLNSYARQHPLYSALKEYGKIPKSDFLLRYVDDVSFRQAIEKQMNKIENANKFSRAIAFGNNQSFLYGDKIEQEMAEGCRRLIKNGSVAAWQHVNLHGEYDFSDEKLQDSVGLHLPPELDILGLHTEADDELGVSTY
jgi:TnpA family transposase